MTSSQSQDGTASHSSKASYRQASSGGYAGSENGLLQKLRRVSRIVWLSLSAAVLVIGSLAWHFDERQWETRSHGIEHLRSTSEPWLSRPRVYQAEAALPDISGRIYAVSVQRDVKTGQNRLWVAGAGGLLAYSDDDGQCWTRLDYANDRGEFREPETNPCSQPSKTAEFRLPGLIPLVLAAAPEESSSPKQSKPSAKQQAQQAVPNVAAQTSQSGAGVEVFPTTLDFGDVAPPDPKAGAANTRHYLLVTVANRTQEPALVSFGGFRGDTSGEFEIELSEACGAELKPGAICSARVIFHPVKEGLKQVVLPVQTNHSATQSIRIAANVPARSGDADASRRAKSDSLRVDKPPAAASGSTTTPPASLPNAPRPPASAPDLLAIDFDLNGTIISTGGLEWDQIDEKTWRFRAVKRGTYPRVGDHTWILTGPSGDWATETRIQSAAVLHLPPKRYGCEDCTIRSQWLDPTTKTAWAVGWSVVNGRDHAVILKNGGKGWEAMTRGALPLADRASAATARPWMLPPPWYLFVLLASVALALPALLPPLDKPLPEGPDTVEGRLSSDKPLEPGDPDVLGLNAIALGLSRFLRNEKTLPPLTVAINGEWGTGKSSLMNLVRCDLKSYGMCPVWFNAWHHQKEEHLLAALLQTVRLEAVPPIWNLLGVPFRARLLTHWLRRRWAQMVALVAALTFLVMLDFHLRFHDHSDLFLWITGQFFPSSGGQASGALSTVPIQGGVVALLATVAALWKGLTAFGANPASLLASVAQGNKMKDLEAQTSFRQRFAIEFRNFTRALGPRRPLVVFIDDLDRCLPANVRDVLEAVNFLVSSGDCFVILGMDKVQVQRAVGLSFKDVADEITLKRPMPSGNGAAQLPDSAGDAGRMKRAEFAQKYLEKLINLEVRVPLAIDDATKRGLFKPAPEKRPEPVLTSGLTYGLQAAQWAVPVALAVLLLAGAYQLSVFAVPAVERWMEESRVMPAAAKVTSPSQLFAPSSPETTGKATKPGGAVAGEGRTSEPANGSTNPALGELLSAVPGETPAISSGREVWPTRWLLSIPIYLLVVFLLLVANVVLTTRPGVVTCDSQPFADAMEDVWYPLVLAKQNTPRAAKRFVNRVRYLAMRQRTFREHSSWWERALFPQRLREPDQVEGGKPIPEPLLVAMAAMEQMEPTWIYDQKVFNDLVGTSDGPGETLKFPSDNPIAIELFQAAREAHRKKFSTEEYSKLSVDWQFLPTYRSRFLVIWPQIDPADE